MQEHGPKRHIEDPEDPPGKKAKAKFAAPLIPPWLFYQEQHNGAEKLTSQPTLRLQADAFVQGDPDYWVVDEATDLKPKALIICDWTLHNWPIAKKLKLLEYFQYLSSQGFAFFYWDEQLLPIPHHQLPLCFFSNINITQLNYPDIRPALENFSAKDHCLLLDYMAIRRLLCEALALLPQEEITFLDWVDFEKTDYLPNNISAEGRNLKTLSDAFKKVSTYPTNITGLINSYYSPHLANFVKAQQTQYPTLKILQKSRLIKANDIGTALTSDSIFFDAHWNGRSNLSLPSHISQLFFTGDISPQAIAQIQVPKGMTLDELHLHRTSESTTLQILKKFMGPGRHLKSLTFYFVECSFSGEQIPQLSIDTSGLVELYIQAKSFSTILLQQMLVDAKKLKILSVFRVEMLEQSYVLSLSPSYHFPDLQNFSYQANLLSSLLLCSVLKTALSLTRLYFNVSSLTADGMEPLLLEPKHLQRLQYLSLNAKLEVDTVIKIVKSAVNLQKLELIKWSAEQFTTFITLLSRHAISSSKIVELNLSSLTCSITDLAKLLHRMPNLQKLKFNSINLTSTASLEQPPVLKYLTLFSVYDSALPLELILNIIRHSPKLTTLSIIKNGSFNTSISQGPFNAGLNHLKEFTLYDCQLSLATFLFLIKQMPHLTELEFKLNDIINGSAASQDLFAISPYLKKVSLYGCKNFPVPLFNALLQQAKSLTEVEISECDSLLAVINEPQYLPYRSILKFANKPLSWAGVNPLLGTSLAEQTTHYVDADTDPSKAPKELSLTKVFYAKAGCPDPAPTLYRIDVFPEVRIQIDANAESPFQLAKAPVKFSTPPPFRWQSTATAVIQARDAQPGEALYGILNLTLTQREQPLTSVSADERLTDIYVDGINPNEIKIIYQDNEDLYYIRTVSPASVNVIVHYTVAVPARTQAPPIWLHELVDYYSHFGAKKLEMQTICGGEQNYSNILTHSLHKPRPSFLWGLAQSLWSRLPSYSPSPNLPLNGWDYLAAIEAQAVGACRHRAVAGWQRTKLQHPDILVRYVGNSVHAFIEVKFDFGTIICDLGGYPAKLNILAPKEILDAPDMMQWDETAVVPVEAPILLEQLQPALMPWRQKAPAFTSTDEFSRYISNQAGKKILLKMATASNNKEVILFIQTLCQQQQRPFYILNAARDLTCAATWIERQQQKGILRHGPGGPFHDFLIANVTSKPLIVINYDNFDHAQLVRTNSIIDKPRLADGTPIPPQATIVALYHFDHPDAYRSTDFTSRFDNKTSFTLTLKEMVPNLNLVTQLSDNVIDLFCSSSWKQLLLGQWTVEGDSLRWEEGKLAKALRSSWPLTIKNGLWEQEAFQLFWQQALLTRTITWYGKTFTLPTDFILQRCEGHDWVTLKRALVFNESPTATVYPLNPTSFTQFMGVYYYDEEKLFAQPGLLKANHGKRLSIYLTRPLADTQWAQLLTECVEQQITLNLLYQPVNILPAALAPTDIASAPIVLDPNSLVYLSEDIDNTLALLQQEYPRAEILDISEFKSPDLLVKITAHWREDNISFFFQQHFGSFWHKLNAGQTLILKGHFTPELVDNLAALYLQNGYLNPALQKSENRGKLILVSNQGTLFQFAQPLQLSGIAPILPSLDLALAPKICASEMLDLSLTTCVAFEQQRLQQVIEGLQKSPSLCILGHTGTGKSTFVRELKKHPDYTIYTGDVELAAWQADRTPGKKKILFYDEAFLMGSDFSRFEGLFNQQRSYLLTPLTQEHGLLLSSNFVSYGAGRNLPTLVARHGNILQFGFLPSAYLFHRVLKPLFSEWQDEALVLAINQIFLRIYEHVVALDETQVLISARELQMMALLTIANPNKHNDPLTVALQMGYLMGKSMLNPAQQKDFTLWLKQQYPHFTPLQATGNIQVGNFVVTPSRYEAYQCLLGIIAVQQLQQTTTNEAQRYAGLGGLLWEGLPGEGKSELIIAVLKSLGFSEQGPKKYYRVSASMPVTQQNERLLQATAEGTFAVKDEFNSGGMQMPFMNSLLMGEDLFGNRPAKPGFKLLGTQNPARHFAGRAPTDLAVQRRLWLHTFASYSLAEVRSILCTKGCDFATATQYAKDYLNARNYALQNNIEELPTIRDLERWVVEQLPAPPPLLLSQSPHAAPLAPPNVVADRAEKSPSLCSTYK